QTCALPIWCEFEGGRRGLTPLDPRREGLGLDAEGSVLRHDARTGQPGAQLAVVPDGQHASTLGAWRGRAEVDGSVVLRDDLGADAPPGQDRKSTRLNSSHVKISYAVFCLKKKKKQAVPRRK